MDPRKPDRAAKSRAKSKPQDARQTTTPPTSHRYVRAESPASGAAHSSQITLATLSSNLFTGLRDHPAAANIALEILAKLSEEETRNTCPACHRPFGLNDATNP